MYIHFDSDSLAWNLYGANGRVIGTFETESDAQAMKLHKEREQEEYEYKTGSRAYSGF